MKFTTQGRTNIILSLIVFFFMIIVGIGVMYFYTQVNEPKYPDLVESMKTILSSNIQVTAKQTVDDHGCRIDITYDGAKHSTGEYAKQRVALAQGIDLVICDSSFRESEFESYWLAGGDIYSKDAVDKSFAKTDKGMGIGSRPSEFLSAIFPDIQYFVVGKEFVGDAKNEQTASVYAQGKQLDYTFFRQKEEPYISRVTYEGYTDSGATVLGEITFAVQNSDLVVPR